MLSKVLSLFFGGIDINKKGNFRYGKRDVCPFRGYKSKKLLKSLANVTKCNVWLKLEHIWERHIFSHEIEGHVILIDDATIFDGTNNCPSINEIKKMVEQNSNYSNFEIDDNIIRIYSNKTVVQNQTY